MPKLLIIEDDQIVANIYRNKFSIDGFQVEIALDGLAGLERRVRAEFEIASGFGLMLDVHSGDDLTSATRRVLSSAWRWSGNRAAISAAVLR